VKRRAQRETPGLERPRPASARSRAAQPRNFSLDPLEPRILLSADPITQALSSQLTEHTDEVTAVLIETVDGTQSRVESRTATHPSEFVAGAASWRAQPADADWTIDLGDSTPQADGGGDWLLADESSAYDVDARSPIAQADSSDSGSPRSDRSADLGEAARADGQKEVRRVVVEPPVDTLSEFANQSFAEPAILASRVLLDDSLVRGPPASEVSLAEGDREDAERELGTFGPSSGAIPEGGLVLLQENDRMAAIPGGDFELSGEGRGVALRVP